MQTSDGVKRTADAQVPGTSGVLGQGAEEQKGETARLVTAIALQCVAMCCEPLCRSVIRRFMLASEQALPTCHRCPS